MSVRTFFASAIMAAGLGVAASSAQAMPINVPGSGFEKSMVQEAAYGCGGGWTRGPYGHCRPIYTCPPGWHTGPFGYHCTRDYVPQIYGFGYGWGWHPHHWYRWRHWG